MEQTNDRMDQSPVVFLACLLSADMESFIDKVQEKNELLNSTLNL